MIYQTIYDTIISAFFNGVTLTGEIELSVTLLSLLACLFVFSLPFIVVYKFIKMVVGG